MLIETLHNYSDATIKVCQTRIYFYDPVRVKLTGTCLQIFNAHNVTYDEESEYFNTTVPRAMPLVPHTYLYEKEEHGIYIQGYIKDVQVNLLNVINTGYLNISHDASSAQTRIKNNGNGYVLRQTHAQVEVISNKKVAYSEDYAHAHLIADTLEIYDLSNACDEMCFSKIYVKTVIVKADNEQWDGVKHKLPAYQFAPGCVPLIMFHPVDYSKSFNPDIICMRFAGYHRIVYFHDLDMQTYPTVMLSGNNDVCIPVVFKHQNQITDDILFNGQQFMRKTDATPHIITVKIILSGGFILPCVIDTKSTIEDMSKCIQRHLYITKILKCTFVYNNRILNYTDTLKECGVIDNSEVHAVTTM